MKALLMIVAASLAACGGGGGGSKWTPDSNPGLPEVVSMNPQSTGDGWGTSTPAAENIDAEQLRGALETQKGGGVDAVIVARHGRLVAESYFNGYGPDTLHDLRSTGKSFTSALAGIAIEQGLMTIDDPISQLIPRFDSHEHMDERKRAIAVVNLLNMNSGLACNDWDPGSPGQEEKIYQQHDWVGAILDLPVINDPGTVPAYCSGGVIVLGHIIALRSGKELDEYAAAYLFGPLGVRTLDWRRSPDGAATGGGGLRLRPRDAAKFGQLYLDGGKWNGNQVVPAAWVERSRQRVNQLGRDGYGWLWWKRTFTHGDRNFDSFFTSGNGGNFIFVVPSLDLVVTFTGSAYNSSLSDKPLEVMNSQILPAVQ